MKSEPVTRDADRSRRRLWTLTAVLGAIGLFVGIAATTVAPATAMRMFGRHHGGFHGGGEIDADRLRHGAAWVLGEVDASDEQIDQVVAIAVSAMTDLRTVHEQFEGDHEAWREALAGEQVDREQLEALRVEALAALDQASQRMAQALADGASVLTPEQRAELIEQHAEHGHRHRGRH